ncbi:DUF2309 domain-containing protein [Archangium gephyra]|uniref:YbcC family protein n=1 Tax=Archangium gephyra TaxID=48 RepID=UPI0035D3FD70
MGQTNTATTLELLGPAGLEETVERACARIAPTWPLDRFIAVNPFWNFIDAPLPEVSARLGSLCGSRLLMPRAWYREQWRAGRFQDKHLREALSQLGSTRTVERMKALLELDALPPPPRRAHVTDVLDTRRDLVHGMSWRDFVTHSLSQFCAAWFDQGQAQLGPDRRGGLYASWHRQAQDDRSPALLMGLKEYHGLARELPGDAGALIASALAALDIAPAEREHYLTSLLLDINGWAAWCAYLRWTARLEGRSDGHLVELLAIRLAWEWLLHRSGGQGLAARWQVAMAGWTAIDRASEESQADDWVLHRALELAYQDTLCRQLPAGLGARRVSNPSVQAVFCIDVRSEVFRRALELQSPSVQTLGFAGFFGLPIEYQPLATPATRPQLPGLLAPRLRATDTQVPEEVASRRERRLDFGSVWKQFKTGAMSGFSFVEALGLFYAGKLVGDSLGWSRPVPLPERAGLSAAEHARRKPRLTGAAGGGELGLAARCELAAGILRAMSLTRGFARLVVLIGHGSETANNPHAAGLDCGACCGQTGEVNARAVAALLNEPEVREGLGARGIEVPASTRFVAGLHNTTTDAVELFDLDELPGSHQDEVSTLRGWLDEAGHWTRAERAVHLGLGGLEGEALRGAISARARDWSQVRPEWGLANNAAFIVAPREHCRHLDLAGRSFLHEYRWEEDTDFAILELIMTAPMVVTHWINLQYYASTVDNARYGSGNKVLHNVVGGNLGVFEGNGGDLRIGLPMQSLHDGSRWRHTPLRLSVFIEAPRPAIERVLEKHAHVRQLVENEWLYLFQLDAERQEVLAWRQGSWVST